jgi:hypothetical protein
MTLWQDLRFAARLLIKDRWFTAVAAIALAHGLPFDNPDRIISIGMTDPSGRHLGVSRLDLNDWTEGAKSFSAFTLLQGAPMKVSPRLRS